MPNKEDLFKVGEKYYDPKDVQQIFDTRIQEVIPDDI